MDAVASLASGFGVALRPENLLFALAGFKTGAQVREAIQQVRAEHGAIVEQLGRKKK